MPHAFKANPNHPAVAYLVRLHADLGGRMQDNRNEAMRLYQAMRHVEAVIKLFDPGYSVRTISAKRKQKTNPWFKRGTLFRAAVEVLRRAGAPMTAREITAAVLAARGIKNATEHQRAGIEAGIRSSLENHAGRGVARIGEGVPRRWRLKAD